MDANPLDLKFFFDGTLKKEQVASAFLAMLLHGHKDFRRMFFDRLKGRGSQSAAEFAEASFEVRVEEKRVDISLASQAVLFLIENKIRAGSITRDQVLRYYKAAKDVAPEKRVVVVLLAPRDIGRSEIENLKSSDRFKANQGDEAFQLSWCDLTDFDPPLGDPWRSFMKSGFLAVDGAIAAAAEAKYPREEREEIVQLVDEAMKNLQDALPRIKFSRWRGKDIEEILTNKTRVTVWSDAVFEADEKGKPSFAASAKSLPLALRTQFRLALASRKDGGLRRWWDDLALHPAIDLPGLGPSQKNADGWFVYERRESGTKDELSRKLFEQTLSVARFLETKM